jgi:hypothetical protein
MGGYDQQMARRIEDILEAIRSLSVEERDRLAERIRRDVDEERRSGTRAVEPKSIIGLFGDEPDLMDRVCEAAMQSRERDPLRQANG